MPKVGLTAMKRALEDIARKKCEVVPWQHHRCRAAPRTGVAAELAAEIRWIEDVERWWQRKMLRGAQSQRYTLSLQVGNLGGSRYCLGVQSSRESSRRTRTKAIEMVDVANLHLQHVSKCTHLNCFAKPTFSLYSILKFAR